MGACRFFLQGQAFVFGTVSDLFAVIQIYLLSVLLLKKQKHISGFGNRNVSAHS